VSVSAFKAVAAAPGSSSPRSPDPPAVRADLRPQRVPQLGKAFHQPGLSGAGATTTAPVPGAAMTSVKGGDDGHRDTAGEGQSLADAVRRPAASSALWMRPAITPGSSRRDRYCGHCWATSSPALFAGPELRHEQLPIVLGYVLGTVASWRPRVFNDLLRQMRRPVPARRRRPKRRHEVADHADHTMPTTLVQRSTGIPGQPADAFGSSPGRAPAGAICRSRSLKTPGRQKRRSET